MSKTTYFRLAILATCLTISSMLAYRYIFSPYPVLTQESIPVLMNNLGLLGPICFIAIFILKSLIFFTATVLSIMAGGIWGAERGFVIVQIALLISTTSEFMVARYIARAKVESLMKERCPTFNVRIKNRGFWFVFVMRIIPNIPWELQNIGYGLTSISLRSYLIATTISGMPLILFLTWTGSKSASIFFS